MWQMRLGELWVATGVMGSAQLDQALAYQAFHGGQIGQAALALELLTPDQLLMSLARQFQFPFVRREGLERVSQKRMRCVPARVLTRLRVCPLRIEWREEGRGTLLVATSEPDNQALLEELSLATGCEVRPVLALAEDLEHVLGRHGLLSAPPAPVHAAQDALAL